MPQTLPPVSPERTRVKTVANFDGINQRDFAQLLKNAVIQLLNYWKSGLGKLTKAPGLSPFFVVTAGTDAGKPARFLVQATSDLWYIGYGQSIATYVVSTDTVTVIADATFTDDVSDALEYGGFVYILSGNAGDILQYIDVSVPATINATTGAPKGEKLAIIEGNRLGIANTDTDSSEVHVSRVDPLTGTPFILAADWTVGNLPTSPFKVSSKNAGDAVGFGKIGKQVVVLFDKGKLGFRIGKIDVDGVGLNLDTQIDFEKIDFGSTRGVVTTSQGIFYTNPFGIFRMLSGGQTDAPLSAVDVNISKPLGDKFLKNYDFSDADLEVDDQRALLLIATRDDSSTNNVVLVYHLDKELRGWSIWNKNITRFKKVDNVIYATSSDETRVWQLDYERGDDNGTKIETRLGFEPQLGAPGELHRLIMTLLGGQFVKGEVISFTLDLMDRTGAWNRGAVTFTHTTVNDTIQSGGMGVGGMGEAGFGADGGEFDAEVNNVIPIEQPTTDFLRIRVWIETTSKSLQELNSVSLKTERRGFIQP